MRTTDAIPQAHSVNTNSHTGKTQTQVGGSGMEIAAASQSIDKGGMRGIGLLAMVIAEISLKKKAYDIAKDYYNTNRQDYDFFRNNHQGPMANTAAEAFGPNNPQYGYDLYAAVPAGIAKSAIIDKQWWEARRRIPKYNAGQRRRLDYDMAVAKAHGVVAGWNIATRYEYNWTDEHNNRRFDKKITVANMGIGVGNIVAQGLSAAVGSVTNSYDNIGDTLATLGNGYMAKSGYEAGRRYTKDVYKARGANRGE